MKLLAGLSNQTLLRLNQKIACLYRLSSIGKNLEVDFALSSNLNYEISNLAGPVA
ncbi:MAG: hypothetical protein ACD_57C00389G0001, partial [uncultured bacterium]